MDDTYGLQGKDKQGPPLRAYEKLEEIGQGAFGKVHKYTCRRTWSWFRGQLPSKMAVKKFKLSRLSSEFVREVIITLHVSHENVVKAFGISLAGDRLYIKMELADSDLAQLARQMKEKRFETDDAVAFSKQIMNGLSYLHDNSICHRDLKPQNILVFWKEEGRLPRATPLASSVTLKLCDFGLSRFVHDESDTATAVGTRPYMAPEVALAHRGHKMLHGDYRKADVFSAGVVIYELLHGEKPFTEVQLLEVEGVIISHKLTNTDGAYFVTRYIRRMLEWRPMDRCGANYLINHWRPRATDAERSSTSLHRAAAYGELEEVEWLIDSGDDVNRTEGYQSTPLHRACRSGHLSVARMLLDRGAEVNRGNVAGNTPLYEACIGCYPLETNSLTEEGLAVERLDKYDEAPNQCKCEKGHYSIARLLIESGADINMADIKGWTPLFRACYHEDMSMIQLLIDKGARVDQANNCSETPMQFACKNGNMSVAKLLIESGADVNKTDDNGRAPLFWACAREDLSIAQMLIRNGANVNTADKCGRTPLQFACFTGFIDAARLLIDIGGADVNRADFKGWTPLYRACIHERLAVAQLLIEKGAFVEREVPTEELKYQHASNQLGQSNNGSLLLASQPLDEKLAYGWEDDQISDHVRGLMSVGEHHSVIRKQMLFCSPTPGRGWRKKVTRLVKPFRPKRGVILTQRSAKSG